jgi:hypothetical protein
MDEDKYRIIINNITRIKESKKTVIVIFKDDCMSYLSNGLSNNLQKIDIETFIVDTIELSYYLNLIYLPNVYFLFTCIFKIQHKLPKKKYMIYQLEQNNNNKLSWHYNYYDYDNVFKNALFIYDYSNVNINVLRNYNISCHYLPIPYKYEKCVSADENKIYDILFIGLKNKRRHDILQQLSNKYNVYIPDKAIYGKELNDLMEQCKILINIHFYGNAILETPRINEALTSNIRIISEKDCIQGSNITDLYSGLVTFIDNIENDYTELFGAVDSILSGENRVQECHIEKLIGLEDNYNKCFEKCFEFFI